MSDKVVVVLDSVGDVASATIDVLKNCNLVDVGAIISEEINANNKVYVVYNGKQVVYNGVNVIYEG